MLENVTGSCVFTRACWLQGLTARPNAAPLLSFLVVRRTEEFSGTKEYLQKGIPEEHPSTEEDPRHRRVSQRLRKTTSCCQQKLSSMPLASPAELLPCSFGPDKLLARRLI